MSRNLRNTIILLTSIFIMTLTAMIYSTSQFNKSIAESLVRIEEVEAKIVRIPQIQTDIAQAEMVLTDYQIKLDNLDKRIRSNLSAAEAYAYLDSVQDKFGFLKCVIAFNSDSVRENYGFKSFSIKGESYFTSLYKFIWAIERGPELYKIKRLSIRSVEEIEDETGELMIYVVFDMIVHAIFADIPNLPEVQNNLMSLDGPRIELNPFYPYVSKIVKSNIDKLPEVERAELKAILPDRVLIVDADEKLYSLSVGDKVYLGYLSKIDHKNKAAVFTLNRGGIVTTFRLSLNLNEKEE